MLMVVPSQRKKGHPPSMFIEKAANTALTERNLETKFKVRMFGIWCNTFGNALTDYQNLSPLLLQVTGDKINNRKTNQIYNHIQLAVHFVEL